MGQPDRTTCIGPAGEWRKGGMVGGRARGLKAIQQENLTVIHNFQNLTDNIHNVRLN